MSVNHRTDGRLATLEQSYKSISNYVLKGSSPNSKTRVLIVDDLKLIIEGLSAIFLDEENIEVVGFAGNGKEAIEQVKELQPDVVVMDLIMPVMGGIDATKVITEKFPDVKILILSSFEDDASVSKTLLAGAHGYVLKSTVAKKLAQAINSVRNGSQYFAPGILNNLAKAASRNYSLESTDKVTQKAYVNSSKEYQSVNRIKPKSTEPVTIPAQASPKSALPKPAKTSPKVNNTLVATAAINTKKAKQPKPEKPLFPYGDWVVVVAGVIILSRTDGMGHHLGHAGLFLLMLALLARPIKKWWSQPLQHRRAVGIFAFAASVAHAIYATKNVLGGNLLNMFSLSTMHLWGLWAGIISLALMAPAAFTSFQSMQRKLGKSWREIHLLTVPSLAIGVFHTVLIGPHYLAKFNLSMLDHTRAYAVIFVGILVMLIRNKTFMTLVKR